MEDVTKIVKVTSNAAYNLDLGFVPEYVRVENVTQWETNSAPIVWFWYRGMGDGYYAGITNLGTAATDGSKPVLGTTNGFTPYDTGSFAARQKLIDTGATKITQATNALVTATTHGLVTGDVVTFQVITKGMVEANGRSTKVTVLNANQFTCDDMDSTGFTAWDATLAGGMFIKTSHMVSDTGHKGVTLGTDIMINANDYLIVRAVGTGNFASVTQA